MIDIKQIKPAKTIDEQISLLKQRGLIIADENLAKNTLGRLNYYTFTGYLHDYKIDSENYRPGITFEKILDIYQCDKRLEIILLYAIDEIEHNLKTKVSHIFAIEIGVTEYLNAEHFKNAGRHSDFCGLFYDAVNKNQHLPFVRHHLKEYGSKFPIWVATELFTLGMLKNFYTNLNTPTQKLIAKEFNTGVNLLSSWMENLTILRNNCAHYVRLYNQNVEKTPLMDKTEKNLFPVSHKVFDTIYIMKKIILNHNDWNNYVIPNIESIFEKYKDSVNPEGYGFPNNWTELLRIK